MARRLAQLDIALYDRVEDELPEVLLDLIVHLISQLQTAVLHGEEKALYL